MLLAISFWHLAIGDEQSTSLDISFGYWPLAISYWLLAIGRWLLAHSCFRLRYPFHYRFRFSFAAQH